EGRGNVRGVAEVSIGGDVEGEGDDADAHVGAFRRRVLTPSDARKTRPCTASGERSTARSIYEWSGQSHAVQKCCWFSRASRQRPMHGRPGFGCEPRAW